MFIIGKTPPPIGGVTVHMERLLYQLRTTNISFVFFDLARDKVWQGLKGFLKYQNIHLHSSNPYLRFLIVLLGKVLGKRVDFTLHGDLGRYKSRLKNQLDLFAIRFAHRPVLLNEKSYRKAQKLNSNAQLISAFLPPDLNKQVLSNTWRKKIIALKSDRFLFCTNAGQVAYDKNDQEIYGIIELIKAFSGNERYGLIISDPSSSYSRLLESENFEIPQNILLLTGPHSFFKVMELGDATIRNTSTDGDSLSVRESLFLGKLTFCTDVVSRPKGTILYKRGDIKRVFSNISKLHTPFMVSVEADVDKIVNLYRI
ncbi:hypothetical protein [Echinicola sediminis]